MIVVDNLSHDDSLTHLTTNTTDDRLQIIKNRRNLGFATACNIAARTASDRANTLLFLNPDCIITAATIERLHQVLLSDPTIGMVGGRLSNPDGSEQRGGRRRFPTPRRAFIRAFGLTYLSRWFPNHFPDFLLHHEPLPTAPIAVEAISGACMLVKREALADVGLWDEGYFLHCEDLDWCMRFHQHHWQVLFVPDAPVAHALGACSHSRPLFVEWHKHQGMLRFYRKFYKNTYAAPLWWLVVIGVYFRFSAITPYKIVRRLAARIGLIHA